MSTEENLTEKNLTEENIKEEHLKEENIKEESLKEKKITIDDIEDFLKCDVCKDIFNDPKTLLCQHTFCSTCLISLKECPMCRLKLYLPEKTNNIFNNLIGLIYGSEKIKELEDRHKREKLEKEMLPKVIDELNSNLNKTIKSSSVNNSNQNYINTEPLIDPVFSIFGFDIKLSTFDYVLKTIEIIFFMYYLYSFYISYVTGNLTSYKIFVNLLILFQSAYTIFTPKNSLNSLNSFGF
jgi:hypothetical protein